MRVVSLLPSATEIVFALGRGDDLVGVTFECDFPPGARQRRVVSTSALPDGLTPAEIDAEVSARVAAGDDLYRLDADVLAEIDAEVVLTQDLCAVCAVDVERVEDAVEFLGCSAEVVTLDPSRLDDVIATFTVVGEALGAADAARRLAESSRARLAALEGRLATAPSRRVLVLEWTDPPFLAGHWVPDLVTAGGGFPVEANVGGDSSRTDWPTVASADAEVVIVAPCGYHLDAAAELAGALVADDRTPCNAEVWAVDADAYFVRPGPRLVDGAELVAQILHPQAGRPDPGRARRVDT